MPVAWSGRREAVSLQRRGELSQWCPSSRLYSSMAGDDHTCPCDAKHYMLHRNIAFNLATSTHLSGYRCDEFSCLCLALER